jgi:YHS domain-containing protein
MTRWQWLGRAVAFAGAIVLIAWLSDATDAQSGPGYGRNSVCPGQPYLEGWGHYSPGWRQWPGRPRLEQVNPRAVDAGVVPTPPGHEQMPLPKTIVPQSPEGTGLQPPTSTKTEEVLPPTILPSEKTLQGPESGTAPGKPSEEKKQPGSTTEPGTPPSLPPLDLKEPNTPPADTAPPSLPNLEELPKSEPAKKPASEQPAKPVEKPKATTPEQPAKQRGSRWESPGAGGRQTASVATPSAVRAVNEKALGVLAVGGEPERNAPRLAAYQTDAVPATAAGPLDRRVERAVYMAGQSPADAEAGLLPVPTEALGGYCPVELTRNGRWVAGSVQWTVVYEGAIYRLSGTQQRQQFLANPIAYAPVQSGKDVVASAREHRVVRGQPAYCAMYNGRLYMFSSATSQAEFNRNPQQYAVKK